TGLCKGMPALTDEALLELFHDEVSRAAARRCPHASADALAYVVLLLQRFVPAYEAHDDKRGQIDGALALVLARSAGLPPDQRLAFDRRCGDLALFVAGVFPESLERRSVGVPYCASIGSAA